MNNEKTKGMDKEGKNKMKQERHGGNTSGQSSEKFDKESSLSQKNVNKPQEQMKK